jgi:hypothetical protein
MLVPSPFYFLSTFDFDSQDRENDTVANASAQANGYQRYFQLVGTISKQVT